MDKYRKKPVEVEAVQWDGTAEGATPIINWILKHDGLAGYQTETDVEDPAAWINIHTLEGIMAAMPKDFIIRGVKGEFYPCKPDIFEATYDKVSEHFPGHVTHKLTGHEETE